MKNQNKTFSNETIHMDFNEFDSCTFKDCTLVYHGFGPVSIVGCSFHNVKWTFADAASHTMNFLAGLYAGAGEGGKSLIESVFIDIRSGKPLRSGNVGH